MDNSTPDSLDEGSYLQETMSQAPTSVIRDLSPLVGIQNSDARVRKPTAPERKKYLDELAAMACYNEAKEICPQYQAPSPWRLSNTLLDEAYTRLKKVDSILAASERINFILTNLQTSTTIESSS